MFSSDQVSPRAEQSVHAAFLQAARTQFEVRFPEVVTNLRLTTKQLVKRTNEVRHGFVLQICPAPPSKNPLPIFHLLHQSPTLPPTPKRQVGPGRERIRIGPGGPTFIKS
jgi:hypothetical protein